MQLDGTMALHTEAILKRSHPGKTCNLRSARRAFLKRVGGSLAAAWLQPVSSFAARASRPEHMVPITAFGAVGDGKSLNTAKIQEAIDHLASQRGGTLEVPQGTFLTGAIFLKPGVHLHLQRDAVVENVTVNGKPFQVHPA